jgi:aspartate aminotransferase-like enzyme
MKKNRIMTPGPVEIPPEVLSVGAKEIPHHRTIEYRNILKNIVENLKYIFKTNNEIFIFTSSGTGAMESAVCNLTSPNDKVLVASTGVFGDRWYEIAKSYNLDVEYLGFEWGRAVDVNELEKKLKGNSFKIVFTTLTETSTGVDNPIEDIGKVTKKYGAILVVDAISGMGATPMKTDEWNVDVAVVGSQKALMIPPGLSFVAINKNALELTKSSKNPKFYFSYEKMLKAWYEGDYDTPFTSAISLVLQLNESLNKIKEEGVENLWNRYKKLAAITRAGITAMGLSLFAKERHSNVITSVNVPEGIDGAKLVRKIQEDFGLTIAGGQKKLKGKIFRIGHIGYVDEFDVITAISAVEITLSQMGYQVQKGNAIKAIEEELIKMSHEKV